MTARQHVQSSATGGDGSRPGTALPTTHTTGDTDTMQTLSDSMEFDHVIRVHEDGTVSDGPAGLYAPELYGVETGTETVEGGWSLLSGYTGQSGYSGPIMHNSEIIGGRLAEDILAEPGYYVSLVCYWPDAGESDDSEIYAEGWAVAYRPTV